MSLDPPPSLASAKRSDTTYLQTHLVLVLARTLTERGLLRPRQNNGWMPNVLDEA